jgi:hypothetical protein
MDLMTIEVSSEVVRYVNEPEGKWARSEFPHPLVTVDYDADDNVISIEMILTDEIKKKIADA